MTPATPKPRASEVCDVCGGRKSACDVLGHRQPGDKTEWQQKPRAGEHTRKYAATRDGRVFSFRKMLLGFGHRMAQFPNAKGYPTVHLSIDGQRKTKLVHKLVAAAYLPPRPSPAHEIRHLNGNPADNRVENLAWGTPQDNADDREKHGRTSRGPAHSQAIRLRLPRPLHCRNGHEYTPANTIIKRVWRCCLICLLADREQRNIKRRAIADAKVWP